MEGKKYQWRATTVIDSTSSLSTGVIPSDKSSWQDETSESGSQTFRYYYRDANVKTGSGYADANSSRVVVSVTDSWTAEYDTQNNLKIKIRTTINSIVRDDLRGTNKDSPGRNINIRRYKGGPVVWSATDNNLDSPHSILSTPITLAEYTITIEPGDASVFRSSIYYYNKTVGYDSWDELSMGIQFRNPMPPDYVPGALLDNAGTWQSHNRSRGDARIRNAAGAWVQMRTINGGVGTDNSPFIRHSNGSWKNMRRIGKE